MAKVVRFHKTGGPEVLQLDDLPVGEPGQGQVRVRHTAIGVNFIDTYQRSGLYPIQLPSGENAPHRSLNSVRRNGVGLPLPERGSSQRSHPVFGSGWE